jgi:hypothetical protein
MKNVKKGKESVTTCLIGSLDNDDCMNFFEAFNFRETCKSNY